jgi:ferritin-like metal-binding protein YciE
MVAGNQMTLRELFIQELKDLYSSESQLIQALPKMAKVAELPELKKAFESHLAETKKQLDRVKQAFESAGETARGELCKGMQGIVAEGAGQIERNAGDLGLIGAGERVEHYEIASYQGAIAMAVQLGLDEAKELLTESLEEEKNAAKLLSQLSRRKLKEMYKETAASAH